MIETDEKKIAYGVSVNQYKNISKENSINGEILRLIVNGKSFEEITELIKFPKWENLPHEERYQIFNAMRSIWQNYRFVKMKNIQNDSIKSKLDGHFEIREKILEQLEKRNPEERKSATEFIVKYIKEKYNIYTIKSDNNTESYIYIEGIYVPNAECSIREICREIMLDFYNIHFTNEVISKIQADTYIEQKDFFVQNNIVEIPVSNGILNLETLELNPFTPEKIFFSKIPITYNTSKECPNIINFIKSIIKDEESFNLILEMFGYCLLKDYRIQKAFMFLGSGSNGKGRLLELLKRFLGPENCTAISIQEIEKDNFALAQLFGKLANISGDISKESLTNTGNFKMLTGGDLISANRKFLTRIDFVNYSKQIFSANDLPRTYDLNDGFFRRWILVDFPYRFLPKKDYEKLSNEEKQEIICGKPKYVVANENIINGLLTEDEMSGLLNLAVLKLGKLLKHGEFSNSKTTEEIRTAWIRKSSSFQAFCLDCIAPSCDGIISKDELRTKYSLYCKKHKVISEGNKVIMEHLTRDYGCSDDHKVIDLINNDGKTYNKLAYVWLGIKFKEDLENF